MIYMWDICFAYIILLTYTWEYTPIWERFQLLSVNIGKAWIKTYFLIEIRCYVYLNIESVFMLAKIFTHIEF
jgi:hypothetical protein